MDGAIASGVPADAGPLKLAHPANRTGVPGQATAAVLRHTPAMSTPRDGLVLFFVLACAITWALDAPLALAFATTTEPPGYALGMAGLSAFGPLIAALVVAARQGEVRTIFRWRTNPVWLVVALFLPMAVHLVATALHVALGGETDRWLHPPLVPEHVAALVFFSIGEEPGWRGFAHPRMVGRFGPVVGSLLLGLVWAVWHAPMLFSPVDGAYDWTGALTLLVELPLWSVVFAWLLVRSNGSLAVAIALHAGGHLDNVNRILDGRQRVLIEVVLVVVAMLAARSLWKTSSAPVPATSG